MKTLLSFTALLPLLLGSCLSSAPRSIPTEGPLRRQVERLVDRHDGYVLSDDTLAPAAQDAALAQSASLETLVALPGVSRDAFGRALVPVADRHDAYVRADADRDPLESETYLATSAQLRRLGTTE